MTAFGWKFGGWISNLGSGQCWLVFCILTSVWFGVNWENVLYPRMGCYHHCEIDVRMPHTYPLVENMWTLSA